MKRIIFIAAAIVVAAGTGGVLMWQNSAAASAYVTAPTAATAAASQNVERTYNCGTSGCTQNEPHSHSSDCTYEKRSTNSGQHGDHNGGHGFQHRENHH